MSRVYIFATKRSLAKIAAGGGQIFGARYHKMRYDKIIALVRLPVVTRMVYQIGRVYGQGSPPESHILDAVGFIAEGGARLCQVNHAVGEGQFEGIRVVGHEKLQIGRPEKISRVSNDVFSGIRHILGALGGKLEERV